MLFFKNNEKNENNESKKNNIIFKLPIEYLEDKYQLDKNIKDDLELIDISNQSLYNNIISSNELKSTKLIDNWSKYYTTNKIFLKDY